MFPVDKLLDSTTPIWNFEETDCETSSLLPSYYRSGNENEKDRQKQLLVRWTINLNLIIVRSTTSQTCASDSLVNQQFFSHHIYLMYRMQNILLFAGKFMVVLVSGSMSLLASVVDAGMDLLSTIILFGASRAVESKEFWRRYKYPVGIRRAEPMGIVVFSVFMISRYEILLYKLWSKAYIDFRPIT
jgi:hypothetical protein